MRRALTAVLAAITLGLSGCGMIGGGDTESIIGKTELRIGVKKDQPGLGLEGKGGKFEGFDVDVATYVAGELGVPPGSITWVGLTSGERDEAIQTGKVDLIFATYSITPGRKRNVTFGGPYYVAHQDTMVRAEDAAEVTNVRNLKGKSICKAEGSNSATRVTVERGVDAVLKDAKNYSECVDMLKGGQVDAVSTDDLILAGFSAVNAGAFKLVNQPFTDEKYGVGIRKGDLDGCEEVNRILTRMYQDGTAQKLLERFSKAGLAVNPNVPQFEGCGE